MLIKKQSLSNDFLFNDLYSVTVSLFDFSFYLFLMCAFVLNFSSFLS